MRSNYPHPVIFRIDIENMRHSMSHALMGYSDKLSEALQQALDTYLTPENVQRVLDTEVIRTLDLTIKEEVQKFFRYDPAGRAIVVEAIKKRLLENTTLTALDE